MVPRADHVFDKYLEAHEREIIMNRNPTAYSRAVFTCHRSSMRRERQGCKGSVTAEMTLSARE
jgi:hypothetical protein